MAWTPHEPEPEGIRTGAALQQLAERVGWAPLARQMRDIGLRWANPDSLQRMASLAELPAPLPAILAYLPAVRPDPEPPSDPSRGTASVD